MSREQEFKLVHETLIINQISFEKRIILGMVELHLIPLVPNPMVLRLNCKQSRIFQVIVNDIHTADYQYCDPTLQLSAADSTVKNLDAFQNCELEALDSVNPDKRLGELVVYLPAALSSDISNLKMFRVSIEFALLEPAGGVHFVLPRLEDGTLLKNAMHMFTYGGSNSSRLWFPCIDSYSELCTWKIEVTTEAMMTVVTSGELIDTKLSPDGKQKTFYYDLVVPTSACNIALAIGPFEQFIDPNMNEVKHFCLPHLMPILKYTTQALYEAFEFYEEMLAVRFPFSSYKQVFVDEAFADMQSYASLTIFNTNLLHSARIIDQNSLTRFALVHGITQQFFGCFISRKSWHDAWLNIGISRYLAYQYVKSTFGNNSYRHAVHEMLQDVCEFEQAESPIVLDSSANKSRAHFDNCTAQTLPARYMEVYSKKATLTLRMLENRLGKELLLQVFNKMLSLASLSATSEYTTGMWDNMIVSTASFIKSVFTVTGKDVQVFIEQWVYQSGCACFIGNFIFNRKRNVVELELKQEMPGKGVLRYVGPLTVTIQELDGSFNHTFKIEENKTKFEITCHSKSRRHKKKKIPLMTGEEVDMDLSAMDADSPVLWLRIDPDMQLLRRVQWEQPDFMYQYQLRHERDVVAQQEAVTALAHFPTAATRQTLMDIIDDDHCFYKIRVNSTHCLVKVANQMVSNWAGPPAMMNIFKKMFGSHSCPNIVRQHKFKNLQQYYLQRAIPEAMANLRNVHGICPAEVLKFILDLFKYSDNSRNKYSDCYYIASLVEAVTNTITPAIAVVSTGDSNSLSLSNETKQILEEITRLLNLEKLLPSYRNVITVSCLKCVRVLQQNGHLPSTASLFKNYSQYGMFIDVRLGALDIIAGFLKEGSSQKPQLDYLLDMAENDPVPSVRHFIFHCLLKYADAISCPSSELSSPELVLRLWNLMNKTVAYDTSLCAEICQLYYKLYGRKKPTFGVSDEKEKFKTKAEAILSELATGGTLKIESMKDESSASQIIDVGDSESKSRMKKKKKKNKHKHKHKSEKKEREHPLHAHPSSQAIANEAVLTLSEPSSEDELLN